MSGRRFSAVSLAYVLIVASIAGTPLVLGTGTAAANTTADSTYVVGQDGQCKAEITPLGDGTQTAPEYYDYRTDPGFYSSHGTTDVQVSDASQIYVYDGSDGTSLVFLHDEFGDEQNGGAITFNVSGLPTDGDWAVEDDNYTGRDDNFDHSGSESEIDWMWAPNRTDGAMFLGLESGNWSEITVDPAFGEDSWAATERDPTWEWADDGPNEWLVRNESGTTTPLDTSQRISFRAGDCGAVSPTASLSGPDNASTGENVTLEASSPDSPTTPIEYRWDFENDGSVDRTTTSTTVEHDYSSSGEVTAAVTVVDRFGQTATATKNVSIDGNAPPTAVASVPASATVGEDVTVDASGSSDDEGIVSYEWDFGDGTTATGVNATHAYGAAGNYTVTLTVTDAEGENDTTTESIEVEEAPPSNQAPTVELSADPGTVTVGENVTLEADASDPDGDSLTYDWTQLSGPASLGLPSGAGGNVTPTDAGTYEVRVTVEDPDGANETDTVTFEAVAQNQAPSASFDWSPTNPESGETVTFDASNSSDPDGNVTSYAWDFDDDGTTDDSGEQANHAFASAGDHGVTLTVTDEDGDNDTATETIQVQEAPPSNQAPTVELSADPTSVTVGENVTLEADASDPDGDDLTYTWSQVSGASNLDLPSGENGSVTPSAAGSYEVSVTVEDPDGANASDTVTFEATEANSPPTAAFDWTPGAPETGQEVTFDASNSTDDDGTIQTYEWDFDDDGGTDATGQTANATFGSAGSQDVTLTVTDDDGATDSSTETVQVGEGNRPPTAALDANATVVAPGEAVALDATGSSDPDGDELSFTWRVVSAPSGASVSPPSGPSGDVTLPEAGDYTFEVNVSDGTESDVATVTVSAVEGNAAPTAAFDWSPTNPEPGQTVTFDASAATDPDGSIASYEWDLDDDGSYEKTGASPTHAFASEGSYDVTLRVTDDDGATDTTTETVDVEKQDSEKNQPPKAVLSASDGKVEVGESVTFDASGSSDPDGSDDSLAFDWAVVSAPSGASLPSFDATATNEVSFDEPGTYEVKVRVEDAEGATDSATETLEVRGDPHFVVHKVWVDDDAVEVDETVKFHVTAENDGTAAGYKTVEVVVDGTVVASKTVEFDRGEEKTVTVPHRFDRPGNYTAAVAGETFDVEVYPPIHSLQKLTTDGDSTLDAGSPGHVTASAKLVVETDVVSSEELNASLDDLDAAAFDVTIGAANATVADVSAGDPVRKGSKWLIPLALDVDAPSNDAGTYDLRVGADLPNACWPIADADCGAGSSIATTGENLVVYEATSSSSGGSGGGSSGSYGGSSSGASGGSSSNADDAAGQEDPTTSDDGDEGTASPTSTVTSTSEETSTPEATTVEEPTTQDSTPSATETESPGQPGFGVGLAVLAILGAALLARLRN